MRPRSPRPMKVFISSTSKDLQQQRLHVIAEVQQMGHEVIAMEHAVARPVDGRVNSLDQVAESHVLVGLIGWRYGTIMPKEAGLSITEQEYRYARERHIPTLMFLGDESLRACMDRRVLDDDTDRLEHFRLQITDENTINYFSCDTDALAGAVSRALDDISRIPDTHHFYVRPLRNDHFVGRLKELRALHEMLRVSPVRRPTGWAGIHPVAVVGMPGAGKTGLAVEYLYTRYPAWDGGVFWLNGARDLTEEAAKAASALDLVDNWDVPVEKKASAFVSRLHDEPLDTLLVIDNVDNPQEMLQATIGETRIDELRCRMLVTTRRRVDDHFAVLPLGTLEEQEAEEIVVRGLPRFHLTAPDGEKRAVAEICKSVGNLPLALNIAARYLEHYHEDVKPSGFLQLIRDTDALYSMEEARQRTDEGRDDVHHGAVRSVFWASWNRLATSRAEPADMAETGRLAQEVLRVAACFPEAASLKQKTLARACDPALTSRPHQGLPTPLSLGLNRLVEESLIEKWHDEQYRLHPLVRAFARSHDVEPDDGKQYAFERAVVMRFGTTLCQPGKLDEMIRNPGGVNAALGELRMAMDLAERLRGRAEARESSVGGTEDAGTESSAQPETWERTLATWTRVFERTADMLFALTEEVADSPPAGVWANSTGSASTTPLWQHLRNTAFDLAAQQVSDAIDQWLIRPGPRVPWLRLEHRTEADHAALMRKFSRHEGAVTCVAWRPDGTEIANGGLDGTIRIWDEHSLKEQVILTQGSDVSALAWRPHAAGSELACASRDGRVTRWKIGPRQQSGQRSLEPIDGPRHQETASALAWDPTGNVLASGARNGSLYQWVIESSSAPALGQLASSIRALAWHPSKQLLACGTRDGRIHLWNRTSLDILPVGEGSGILAHRDGVWALAWSPTGNWLASGGEDGIVRLWKASWDVLSGAPLLEEDAFLVAQGQAMRSLAWAPDGKLVAAGDASGAVSLWRLDPHPDSLETTSRIEAAHAGIVHALAWSPDGDVLVSAGEDRLICLWRVALALDAGMRTPGLRLVGHERPVRVAAWSGDGEIVGSAGADATIRLWTPRDGRQLAVLEGQVETCSIAMSPDGQMLASGGGAYDRTVRVWVIGNLTRQVRAHEQEPTPQSWTVGMHQDDVRAIAWDRDSALLATGSSNMLRVWEARVRDPGLKPLWVCARHDDEVLALAWHPLRALLASSSRDRILRVWDVGEALDGEDDSEPLCYWWGSMPDVDSRSGFVRALAWDPTGRVLATGADNGQVGLWIASQAVSLQTPRLTIPAHRDAVVALAWSRDGMVLATAGRDRAVRLWTMPEGNPLAAFYTYAPPIALRWSARPAQLLVCDVLGPPWHPRFYHLRLEGLP